MGSQTVLKHNDLHFCVNSMRNIILKLCRVTQQCFRRICDRDQPLFQLPLLSEKSSAYADE